jgi:hypothetical protein
VLAKEEGGEKIKLEYVFGKAQSSRTMRPVTFAKVVAVSAWDLSFENRRQDNYSLSAPCASPASLAEFDFAHIRNVERMDAPSGDRVEPS